MKTLETLATNQHEPTRTDTNQGGILHKELSYKIVEFGIEIRKKLGLGFLEKVYENALMVLLRRAGIKAVQQSVVDVYFEGEKVGHYVADILVEDSIIVEIKCASAIVDGHRAQALNYLKATNLHLALILNFGPSSFDHQRVVL